MPCRILFLAAFCLLAVINSPRAEQLHVLAAGSLREVLGGIGSQYRNITGVNVTADFGPSGVLRERVEHGERADLFASADVGHPLILLKEGLAQRLGWEPAQVTRLFGRRATRLDHIEAALRALGRRLVVTSEAA
ncbi:MAG: substrate-binding domain-containing protein [Stellaceae bacterium]